VSERMRFSVVVSSFIFWLTLQKCQSGGRVLNGRPVGLALNKCQSGLSQTVGHA